MKLRKAIATFVAASMAFASVGFQSVSGATFPDMPNDWSRVASEAAVNNGLLAGINGKFMPKATVPRSQVAAVVNRAFGASEMANISGVTDVPQGVWYASDMAKAVQMGTMVVTNSKLNPTRLATREEVFAILCRAFVISPATSTTALNKFSDAGQISSWAKPEMAAMVEAGYITGSNGKINPKGHLTREEFAVVMNQMVKTYVSTPGEITSVNAGNVMVNAAGTTLKGLTIDGDLIIGDGVGSGTVTLDGVKVSGRTIFRTGKEASVDNKNGSDLGKVVLHTASTPTLPLPSTPDHGSTTVPTTPATSTGGLGSGSSGSGSTGGGSPTTPVNNTKVATVDVTPSTLALVAGGTVGTLTVSVGPSTATNKAVNWTSNNTSVATVTTVNNVVTVTPLSAGTTTIKALAADGSGVYDTCTVTVNAAPVVSNCTVVDVQPSLEEGKVLIVATANGVTSAADFANTTITYKNGSEEVVLERSTTVPKFFGNVNKLGATATFADYQAKLDHVTTAPAPLPTKITNVGELLVGEAIFTLTWDGINTAGGANNHAKYIVKYDNEVITFDPAVTANGGYSKLGSLETGHPSTDKAFYDKWTIERVQ